MILRNNSLSDICCWKNSNSYSSSRRTLFCSYYFSIFMIFSKCVCWSESKMWSGKFRSDNWSSRI